MFGGKGNIQKKQDKTENWCLICLENRIAEQKNQLSKSEKTMYQNGRTVKDRSNSVTSFSLPSSPAEQPTHSKSITNTSTHSKQIPCNYCNQINSVRIERTCDVKHQHYICLECHQYAIVQFTSAVKNRDRRKKEGKKANNTPPTKRSMGSKFSSKNNKTIYIPWLKYNDSTDATSNKRQKHAKKQDCIEDWCMECLEVDLPSSVNRSGRTPLYFNGRSTGKSIKPATTTTSAASSTQNGKMMNQSMTLEAIHNVPQPERGRAGWMTKKNGVRTQVTTANSHAHSSLSTVSNAANADPCRYCNRCDVTRSGMTCEMNHDYYVCSGCSATATKKFDKVILNDNNSGDHLTLSGIVLHIPSLGVTRKNGLKKGTKKKVKFTYAATNQWCMQCLEKIQEKNLHKADRNMFLKGRLTNRVLMNSIETSKLISSSNTFHSKPISNKRTVSAPTPETKELLPDTPSIFKTSKTVSYVSCRYCTTTKDKVQSIPTTQRTCDSGHSHHICNSCHANAIKQFDGAIKKKNKAIVVHFQTKNGIELHIPTLDKITNKGRTNYSDRIYKQMMSTEKWCLECLENQELTSGKDRASWARERLSYQMGRSVEATVEDTIKNPKAATIKKQSATKTNTANKQIKKNTNKSPKLNKHRKMQTSKKNIHLSSTVQSVQSVQSVPSTQTCNYCNDYCETKRWECDGGHLYHICQICYQGIHRGLTMVYRGVTLVASVQDSVQEKKEYVLAMVLLAARRRNIISVWNTLSKGKKSLLELEKEKGLNTRATEYKVERDRNGWTCTTCGFKNRSSNKICGGDRYNPNPKGCGAPSGLTTLTTLPFSDDHNDVVSQLQERINQTKLAISKNVADNNEASDLLASIPTHLEESTLMTPSDSHNEMNDGTASTNIQEQKNQLQILTNNRLLLEQEQQQLIHNQLIQQQQHQHMLQQQQFHQQQQQQFEQRGYPVLGSNNQVLGHIKLPVLHKYTLQLVQELLEPQKWMSSIGNVSNSSICLTCLPHYWKKAYKIKEDEMKIKQIQMMKKQQEVNVWKQQQENNNIALVPPGIFSAAIRPPTQYHAMLQPSLVAVTHQQQQRQLQQQPQNKNTRGVSGQRFRVEMPILFMNLVEHTSSQKHNVNLQKLHRWQGVVTMEVFTVMSKVRLMEDELNDKKRTKDLFNLSSERVYELLGAIHHGCTSIMVLKSFIKTWTESGVWLQDEDAMRLGNCRSPQGSSLCPILYCFSYLQQNMGKYQRNMLSVRGQMDEARRRLVEFQQQQQRLQQEQEHSMSTLGVSSLMGMSANGSTMMKKNTTVLNNNNDYQDVVDVGIVDDDGFVEEGDFVMQPSKRKRMRGRIKGRKGGRRN